MALHHRIITVCLAAVCPAAVVAQHNELAEPARLAEFSPAEIRADLTILRASLEEGHGGLYRHTSKASLDRLFGQVHENLDSPHTQLDLFRRLAPLIAAINDGHTRLLLPAALTDEIERQPVWFPLRLRLLGGRAYVQNDYTGSGLFPPGSEITSINGMPITDVLDRLRAGMSSDGHIETFKTRRLEGLREFGRNYTLLIERCTSFSIGVTSSNGDTTTTTTPGRTWLDLAGESSASAANAAAKTIEMRDENGIGIMTIHGFGDSPGATFAEALQRCFENLRASETTALVIDLRGNGGGRDEYGRLLLSYFVSEPFQYYSSLEVRTDELRFLKHTDSAERKPPPGMLTANDHGTFDLNRHPNLGTHDPSTPGFTGRVVALIDGGSFSTTSEFISQMHSHKLATFVGEESGGGYYGNTSGFVPVLTMPKTGLRLRVPVMKYTMAVKAGHPTGRGVIPEHPVETTIEAVLAGSDPVLEFARQLL